MTYGEITSANRNTSLRLAPDFSFLIRYDKREVTLYEDHGPGCVFRIFLYPSLPTDYTVLQRLTFDHLGNLSLVIDVDGEIYTYGLDQMGAGNTSPFLYPLSARHAKPTSGLGAYTPICYQQSLRIVYRHSHDLPPDLLLKTIDCATNELACPVKIYSGVSRHKYPYGAKIAPFTGGGDDLLKVAAERLTTPEQWGPDGADYCELTCVELPLCRGCQHVLYHSINYPGVITAFKLRLLYEDSDNHTVVLPDWMDYTLTIYFDDAAVPQINHIPLGSLFGAAGSLNDFRGAAFGRTMKYCYYSNAVYKRYAMTGYLYLPMPFWQRSSSSR